MLHDIGTFRIRRERFFTQQEFAKLIGVTNQHISRVENGKETLGDSTRKLANVILTYKEGGDLVEALMEQV